MLKSIILNVFLVVGLLVMNGEAVAQHAHGGDIIVGRTLAGHLAIEADLDEDIFLAVSVNPILPGWLGDEPGFVHLEADEPDEDFYTLAAGADIYLDLISVDTGLQFAPLTLSPLVDEPTDALLPLGDDELHSHVLFNISNVVLPSYDGTPLSATFQLVDLGGTGYSPSSPFTMTFVPEPMTGALLIVGGLGLVSRRKQRVFVG